MPAMTLLIGHSSYVDHAGRAVSVVGIRTRR
jgi:hypothetical protein